MGNCRPAKISISFEVTNFLITYEDQVIKSIVAWHQLAIKAIICLTLYTYPDLRYVLKIPSLFCNNPEHFYVKLIKHILQYISGILDWD